MPCAAEWKLCYIEQKGKKEEVRGENRRCNPERIVVLPKQELERDKQTNLGEE